MERKALAFPLRRALLGGALGTLLAIILIFICAVLTEKSVLPQGREAVWGRAALFLGCILAGGAASTGLGRGNLLAAAAGALVPLAAVILFALFTKDSSVLNMSLLYNLVCIISGSFLGYVFLLKRGRRHRRRRPGR